MKQKTGSCWKKRTASQKMGGGVLGSERHFVTMTWLGMLHHIVIEDIENGRA